MPLPSTVPTDLRALPPSVVRDQVEAVIRDLVLAVIPARVPAPHGRPPRGRPPILPAFLVWGTLLVGVVRGIGSQRELWRHLALTGMLDQAPVAISLQGLTHRLVRAGVEPMVDLFGQISQVLGERLEPWLSVWLPDDLAPFASDIVAIDEAHLDAVARSLPALRAVPAGDDRLLPGKLAGVFDLRRQQWRVVQWIEAVHQNEKVVARELIAHLRPGSLIIADLGYFAFAWFDDLTDAGHWWISKLRTGTSTVVVHTFITTATYRDQLVFLGAHRADRASHLVRLVEVKVGQTWHGYLTNQTDPVVLPAADLIRLYARRWDIELAIALIKDTLGLGVLWSAKPVLVQQQCWAVLIIAQILQALRLEIAARAGVEPFDVSMVLVVRWAPRLAAQGHDPIAVIVAEGRRVGIIRPSRRCQPTVPVVTPNQLCPAPPGLVRERTPRHAQRKCGSRPRQPVATT